jgi:hypothetical protein
MQNCLEAIIEDIKERKKITIAICFVNLLDSLDHQTINNNRLCSFSQTPEPTSPT